MAGKPKQSEWIDFYNIYNIQGVFYNIQGVCTVNLTVQWPVKNHVHNRQVSTGLTVITEPKKSTTNFKGRQAKVIWVGSQYNICRCTQPLDSQEQTQYLNNLFQYGGDHLK